MDGADAFVSAAGATEVAAPDVAEAWASSVTLRWLSAVTVIGASFVPPTLTETAVRSAILLMVVAPVAEAGAEPDVAPDGTSPECASATPVVFTCELVEFVSVPAPWPPTAPIDPAWALVRVVSVTRPTLEAPPVVVFEDAAGAALAMHASFGAAFAATAPVRSPPVWVSVAVVPQEGVALSVAEATFGAGATTAPEARGNGDGDDAAAPATDAADVGETLGVAIDGAELVAGEPLGAAATEAAGVDKTAAAADNAGGVVGVPLGAGIEDAEAIVGELIGAEAV